eukprot:11985501-Karenia_brevis.AAC.1
MKKKRRQHSAIKTAAVPCSGSKSPASRRDRPATTCVHPPWPSGWGGEGVGSSGLTARPQAQTMDVAALTTDALMT